MEKKLNTGRITKRVEQKFNERKSVNLNHYMNYYEWLTWMKDEAEFKKFESMLEGMLKNWLIKPKDKAEILTFFYPKFEARVETVRKAREQKHKKLNFICKPMMSMVWGC